MTAEPTAVVRYDPLTKMWGLWRGKRCCIVSRHPKGPQMLVKYAAEQGWKARIIDRKAAK